MRLRKAFTNSSSANTKLLKTQLHKIGQSGGFVGRLLGLLVKSGLFLMKNMIKALDKSVLILFGLTAAASATIHKKISRSSTSTLIISNEELNDIMRIAKSLEESGLLIKGVSKMLLSTLGVSLLGNQLTGIEVKTSKIPGQGVMRAGEGTIRAGQYF